ncbi:hypothetical protein MGYG_04797 [Nannizzia gypsea CBS 118893]|uniref:Uncharacterized protein n=1 Tax=Arthroderma gypseum (strain ATCC MYA-4604 / CBS 118893) TaxID=535722 RepID=E4UWU3_ARTGP|nr:hypothetical protein MGYG_04797 [Nannizzia gypsea CBS 118893]EFR01796.1 hypothetical protein MGYG_04797 [Nannizzia gypsea CBS 118893]
MIDHKHASLSQIEAALSKMTVEETARLASVFEFEGALAEKFQNTSFGSHVVDSDGMIRIPAVLFAGDANKGLPGITLTPTTPSEPITPGTVSALSTPPKPLAMSSLPPSCPPPPPMPAGFEFKNHTERYFFAIAARALQEAAKLPEQPPPNGWLPSQKCPIFYSSILDQFTVIFRERLQSLGRYQQDTFIEECQHHYVSIFNNIRSRWHYAPFGSIDGFRTTINTPNCAIAAQALKHTVRKPTSPPPANWKINDPLHTYYVIMLARFRIHLRNILSNYDILLIDEPIDVHESTCRFIELVIQEYRRIWITNHGLE